MIIFKTIKESGEWSGFKEGNSFGLIVFMVWKKGWTFLELKEQVIDLNFEVSSGREESPWHR